MAIESKPLHDDGDATMSAGASYANAAAKPVDIPDGHAVDQHHDGHKHHGKKKKAAASSGKASHAAAEPAHTKVEPPQANVEPSHAKAESKSAKGVNEEHGKDKVNSAAKNNNTGNYTSAAAHPVSIPDGTTSKAKEAAASKPVEIALPAKSHNETPSNASASATAAAKPETENVKKYGYGIKTKTAEVKPAAEPADQKAKDVTSKAKSAPEATKEAAEPAAKSTTAETKAALQAVNCTGDKTTKASADDAKSMPKKSAEGHAAKSSLSDAKPAPSPSKESNGQYPKDKSNKESNVTESYASAAAHPVHIPDGHSQTKDNDEVSSKTASTQVSKETRSTVKHRQLHATSQEQSAPAAHSRKVDGRALSRQASSSGMRTPNRISFDNMPQQLGVLGNQLQTLAHRLEDRLRKLGDQPDWIGAVARQALSQGHWVEEHLEEEWALRKDAIGGIDNMWILLSSVSRFNPVCTATFVFKGKVERKNLERVIAKQVDTFPKYKQVLRNRGRKFHGSVFVDDPEWDLNRHITEDSLPEPAGSKELDDYTARLIAKDWDFNKPLWEMIIIDNYKGDGLDGSAIITRGHHTLTDGQGFVMSQLYISSFGDDLEKLLSDGRATLNSARRGTAKPSKLHKGLKPLDRYHNNTLLQISMFFLFWFFTVLSSIAELFGGVKQGFNFAMYFLTDSWRPRHLTSDYQGERVAGREFATSNAVPISDVRKLQRAFSGPTPGGWVSRTFGRKQVSWWGHLTLNDILVTVIADVLADELDHQKQIVLPTIGSRIRQIGDKILRPHLALMIPISIRPVANWEMRNWSTGSVVWLSMPGDGKHGLPISARAMHARLHDVSQRLKVLKNSILPTLTFWSVQLTGQAPVLFPSPLWKPIRSIVAFWLELVLTSFSAVVTNVPGPPGKEGIEFADAPVKRWAASPPQAGKGTLGIGIISYADSICITIAADDVVGSPSQGVARRLTDNFSKRWQQYLDTADDVLARRGVSREHKK